MTSRQFYIMVCLFVVMTKMQRFPSLLYDVCGKDGYIVIILYALINLLGILLAFLIYKFLNRDKMNTKGSNWVVKLVKRILMLAMTVYFMIQALLLFEHVQNIFADTLFDKFAWSIFSLLFLFAIFYLAKTGIKNIAINFELFAAIVFGALFLIAVLGTGNADYSVILPFESIDFSSILANASKFNIWFGDFFIILFMLFHTKEPKLSKTILAYIVGIVFIVFLTITFYGVFGEYSALQPGMISTITEQSMLGVNIGRVDWFLILFAEIGTILSCSVCIYFANKSLCAVFPKIRPLWIAIFIAAAFYVCNVYLLVDKFVVREFFFGIGGILSLALKLFITFILLIIAICHFAIKKYDKEVGSGKIS